MVQFELQQQMKVVLRSCLEALLQAEMVWVMGSARQTVLGMECEVGIGMVWLLENVQENALGRTPGRVLVLVRARLNLLLRL